MQDKGPSVLLIYTGGTIGMKEDGRGALTPFDFDGLMEFVPELGRFTCRIDHYSFSPLIDSSDVEPGLWARLAEIIRDRFDDYDGFVILHGTDTMAYSASALSFMLENLSKPVIFTSFHAFRSPNYPPLATAGIDILYNDKHIMRPASEPFRINTSLDTRVSILKVHPGITPQVVRDILLGSDTRAVIIETYGSGNAISKDWFVDIVRQSSAMGKILLNVTQCLAGTVNMDIYATGRALRDAGVVSGRDLTTEAALAKLFFLMGSTADNADVKRRLVMNLRGEIS